MSFVGNSKTGPPAGSGYFRAGLTWAEFLNLQWKIQGGIKREKRHSDALSMSIKEGGLERHKLNG